MSAWQGEPFVWEIFFRRDPAEVVAWRVWQGGFEEYGAWPSDYDGLALAGRWAVEHRAIWKHSGFPVRSVEDLTCHAGAI